MEDQTRLMMGTNKACPHNVVSSTAHVKKLLQLSSFDGKGKQRLSSVALNLCGWPPREKL